MDNHRDGKLIAVSSMKGGVGKTEVSLNLAVALKQNTSKRVVVVDFDIPYGGVSQALKMNKSVSLTDWISINRDITEVAANSIVCSHESGIDFIPAIASSNDQKQLTTKKITSILTLLRTFYDIVIIDTGVDLSRITKAVLSQSDQVVIVTSASTVSVWNNHQYKEDLIGIGVDPQRMSLFINQVPRKHSEINVDKIIQVYENKGVPVRTATVAYYDEQIRKLRNKGTFIYSKKSSSDFHESINELMESIGLYANINLLSSGSGVFGFMNAIKKVFAR